MKNFLIVIFMLVVFNGILVFSGALDKLLDTKEDTVSETKKIDQDIVDVFRFTLEDEVVKKIGQPIEGFEPQMFLAVFPGLVETDFNNVQSSQGIYKIQEGRLIHSISETGLVHSAAGAIGRKGMETLLNNVSNRTGIDLTSNGTITDIMSVLTEK